MRIDRALKYLYPAADPNKDYKLQNDGSGVYIKHWNTARLGPQPTVTALAAAADAYTLQLAGRRQNSSRSITALMGLNPATIQDPALKAVVEYLQNQEN